MVSYNQCNVRTGHHCVLEITWSVISSYFSYHLSFQKKWGCLTFFFVYICKLHTCKQEDGGIYQKMRDIALCVKTNWLVINFTICLLVKNPTLVQMRSKYIPTYFIDVLTNHKMFGLLSHCNIPLLNRLSLYDRKTSSLFWNMSVTSMPIRDQFVMTTWKIYKFPRCWSRDINRPVVSIYICLNVVSVVNWIIILLFNHCLVIFFCMWLYLFCLLFRSYLRLKYLIKFQR